jgi:hypothetical protein
MAEKLGNGPSEKEGQVDRRNLLKGAAAAGLGAMALGAASAAGSTGGQSGQEVRAATNAACEETIQNLVAKMAADAEFARAVIAEPQNFQQQYGLSRRAVDSLRGLRLEDFEHIKVSDANAFAQGAFTTATMARHDFASTASCGDTCYYFG